MKWNYAIRRLFRRGKINEALNMLEEVADFIESNPEQYQFDTIWIPDSIYGKACALGWAGYFAGFKNAENSFEQDEVLRQIAKQLGFGNDGSVKFYRMLSKYDKQLSVESPEVVHNIRQYIQDKRG